MARKSWILIGTFVVFMLSVLVVVPVSHATLLDVDSKIKIYNNSPGNGGPYDVDIIGNDAVYDYQTFCVEFDEYFTPGNEYTVGDISDTAYEGGVAGAEGAGDPLDAKTAIRPLGPLQ
jgi:hypothetical protein